MERRLLRASSTGDDRNLAVRVLLVWQGGCGDGLLYGKLVLLLGMQLVHAGLAAGGATFPPMPTP